MWLQEQLYKTLLKGKKAAVELDDHFGVINWNTKMPKQI